MGSLRALKSIGKAVQSRAEVSGLVHGPSRWSPAALAKKKAAQIDNTTLDAVLDLSGLAKPAPAERSALREALQSQIGFLDSLATVNPGQGTLTRLLDDNRHATLTHADICAQIAALEADPAKGETPGSWDPTALASDVEDNFVKVNEGLYKEK